MALHQTKRAASPMESGRRVKARPEDSAKSAASLDQPIDPKDEKSSQGLASNGVVLSTEVELLIFSHLDTKSRRSLCLTSKYFRKIVMGEYFRVIALGDSPKHLSSTMEIIQRQSEGWFNHVQEFSISISPNHLQLKYENAPFLFMGMRKTTSMAQYHCPEFPIRVIHLLGGSWNGPVTTPIRFPNLTRLTLDIEGLVESGESELEELADLLALQRFSGLVSLCIRGLSGHAQFNTRTAFAIRLITASPSLKKLDIDAYASGPWDNLFKTVYKVKNLEALQIVSDCLCLTAGYGIVGILPKLKSRTSLKSFSVVNCYIKSEELQPHDFYGKRGRDKLGRIAEDIRHCPSLDRISLEMRMPYLEVKDRFIIWLINGLFERVPHLNHIVIVYEEARYSLRGKDGVLWEGTRLENKVTIEYENWTGCILWGHRRMSETLSMMESAI